MISKELVQTVEKVKAFRIQVQKNNIIPGELVLISPIFRLEKDIRFESIGIYLKAWKGEHSFHYGTICDVILPGCGICTIELDRIFPLQELSKHHTYYPIIE